MASSSLLSFLDAFWRPQDCSFSQYDIGARWFPPRRITIFLLLPLFFLVFFFRSSLPRFRRLFLLAPQFLELLPSSPSSRDYDRLRARPIICRRRRGPPFWFSLFLHIISLAFPSSRASAQRPRYPFRCEERDAYPLHQMPVSKRCSPQPGLSSNLVRRIFRLN